MSIRTTLFPEYQLGYNECTGDLSVADLARGYANFQAMPDALHIQNTINDLRGLGSARMFPEGLEQFGRVLIEDMSKARTSRNIVLLAPPKAALGLVSEYARQINASGHGRCAVHFDFERALDWLGLPHSVMMLPTESGRRLIDIDPGWPR